MVKVIQASLAGGEVSEAVAARVDIAKYQTSLAACENMFVQTSGGVANRTGTQFVCEVKDSSLSTRIIPFEFNVDQTYILEMGNEYIRVIADAGLVVDSSAIKTISGATAANPVVVTSTGHLLSNGDEVFISSVVGMTELNGRQFKIANVAANTFELQDMDGVDIDGTGYTTYSSAGSAALVFEVTTPYQTADLFEIQFVQSADVMTLTHPSYEPRELIRTANDAWTLSVIVFQPEQTFPTGMSVTANTTGAVVEQYVVTAVSRETAEESLRATGSSWTISGATAANPVVITATSHGVSTGDEIHISGVVGMTELNGQRFKAGTIGTHTISLEDTTGTDIDGSGYTAYSSAGDVFIAYDEITNGATTADNTITWTAAAGAESYNVYKADNGLFGFIGRTEALTFTDDNISRDLSDTPPQTRNPFLGSTNYPSTCGFYQQRRIFGNTNSNTQRNYFTQTANFYNMAVSSPAKDDDAITATIAALRINEIKHYIPLIDLIVLTSGGEWVISGVDDKITPAGIQVKPQSYYGSTSLRPIVAGDVGIFMQPGQTVRDLGYKFETDAYSGNDISILARHLFDYNTVVDWDFSQAPLSILWGVRDDGILVALTYLREQEIYGWHRHTTQGDFKSTASVREGDDDITYFIVERKIGTRTVKYIERLKERTFEDIQDAPFVDASVFHDVPITITGFTNADPIVVTATSHGLSNGDIVDISDLKVLDTSVTQGHRLDTEINGTGYTVANKTTHTFELQNNGADVDGTAFGVYHSGGKVRLSSVSVGFLWHLEGEEVVCLANGYVVRGLTVTNGKITLPDTASRVHVGFGYTAEIETLRLDAGTGAETIQGKAKKVSRLTVRVERTLGMWMGSHRDRMREAKFGLPALLGQPPAMLTGDKDVTLPPEWNKEGKYIIQQRDPLPLTVLSLIPDAIIGGN
mgnify:FL=1